MFRTDLSEICVFMDIGVGGMSNNGFKNAYIHDIVGETDLGVYGAIHMEYAKDSERTTGGEFYAVSVYILMLIKVCQYVSNLVEQYIEFNDLFVLSVILEMTVGSFTIDSEVVAEVQANVADLLE